jgi:thioredoxin-like negative regulator of GroEL
MKRYSARGGALLVLAMTAAIGLLPAMSATANEKDLKKHGPIAWQGTLQAAMKIAARERKPLLVDFWAEWCGPCKEMLATTYKDKAVVARSKQFVPVLINADEQPKVLEKFGISALPTVIFMNAKGKILLQTMGYDKAPEFLKLMDQAAKKFK